MQRTILTMAEVSTRTGVPLDTLRYWRHVGEGGPKSWKLGRRVVYDEADVEAWLDAQRGAEEPKGAA